MIRVLFIHQNLPGQFRRLLRYPRTRPGLDVVAIGVEAAAGLPPHPGLLAPRGPSGAREAA